MTSQEEREQLKQKRARELEYRERKDEVKKKVANGIKFLFGKK